MGSVAASATGAAQLGTVRSGTNTTVTAASLALTTANAGGALALTATSGALTLGTGTSGGDATLIKQGATRELSLGTLNANQTSFTAGTVVTSATSVRADTISSANGPVTVTAQAGDLTGQALPSPATGFGTATVITTAGAITLHADNGVAQRFLRSRVHGVLVRGAA